MTTINSNSQDIVLGCLALEILNMDIKTDALAASNAFNKILNF